MQITAEQELIVLSTANLLRVNAFAGTGKTSTLDKFARARPLERMLYIAFNKPIQLEAQKKFPSSVKCMTSHGLAYPGFGARYSDAQKLVPKIRVSEVVQALGLDHYPEDFRLYVADAALRCVERFTASDAEVIHEDLCAGLITPGAGVEAGDIAALAQQLWGKMCDLQDRSIGMVHDGYLKLYQLSRPVLNFGTILFDEYQDANPVTAALLEAQTTRKVVVGDSHQQLYSFRGATNAMQRIRATQTLYLSKSFRFGQGIADVANLLLSTYKGERRHMEGTAVATYIGGFARSTKCAVIARANATLFDEAFQAISQGRKVHFVGGIAGYRIGDALDAYNLWSGNHDSIQSPYLKSFREFDRMDDYAGAVNDKELKSLIGLVKRHGSKLPRLVKQIRGGTEEEAGNADVILTTAHKSKGMEWDNVRLTDDYIDLLDERGLPRKIAPGDLEEVNIAYVAATRARRALCPFPDLANLITHNKTQARDSALPDWARPATTSVIRSASAR